MQALQRLGNFGGKLLRFAAYGLGCDELLHGALSEAIDLVAVAAFARLTKLAVEGGQLPKAPSSGALAAFGNSRGLHRVLQRRKLLL
jgi:hypothetical protein